MADTTVDANVKEETYYRNLRLGPVWIDEDTAYVIYLDPSNTLVYRKTADGGATWGNPVDITASTGIAKASIWYDKWTTGDAGTKIHCAYLDSNTDNTYYRDLDTSDDGLGDEITVADDALYDTRDWNNACVDITKARGGYLYIGYWGATFGEKGFYRSTDDGANWASRADVTDGNAVDRIILMPGNEADNQDIWCIYWDVSANEITLKIYDDSGNTWASETSIGADMVAPANYYQMSAAPRQDDDHVILAAWSEIDAATADLKVWDIGGSGSITAKTNIITDTAEIAQAAVMINQQNDDIYVAYIKGGTFESTVDIKYKKSADGGGSWGGEQAYSEAAADDLRAVWAGISVGDAGGKFQPAWFDDDDGDLFVNLVNDVDIAAADGVTTRRYSLPVLGVG